MPVTAALLCLLAAPIRFERVDLIAADPATWINYDLPTAAAYPPLAAVRFGEQVQTVWSIRGADGWFVGTSLRSQSVVRERALGGGAAFSWTAGVQTRLGLPSGAVGGLAWRRGRLRLGAGISLLSGTTRARPSWTSWRALPSVSVGIGRTSKPR